MIPSNFCAFILTHGRPNTVPTYQSLRRHGYTGKVYIVIDNEDKTSEEYYRIFGDKVIMFDKKAIAATFDEADNFEDRRAIVYARNACFQIAKDLGVKYFIQLDDDYTSFSYKVEVNGGLTDRKIYDLDNIFFMVLAWYKKINALSVAMAQGGDFIGGNTSSKWSNGFHLLRKCMNTFICSTERPFTFIGRINEDVNTYVSVGGKGGLFFTVPDVKITQAMTQSNSGGMTDIYLDSGTYRKSFYTVMFSPSCVKIGTVGVSHQRLHHQISWKNAVPVILDEKYKKSR